MSNGRLFRGKTLGSKESRFGGQSMTGDPEVSFGTAQMEWHFLHSFPRRQKPSIKSWQTPVRGGWGSVEGWNFAARIFVPFAMTRRASVSLN